MPKIANGHRKRAPEWGVHRSVLKLCHCYCVVEQVSGCEVVVEAAALWNE